MKKFAIMLFVLASFQAATAQNKSEAFKFAEADYPAAGCGEWSRVDDFARKILEQDGAKGLMVVYAGDGKERFGNILAFASGAKRWLVAWYKFPPDRISFVITEGKTAFAEEFWIIPAGAQEPKFKSFDLDWANLTEKYFFSTDCFECEPSYPDMTANQANFEKYAEVLKQYPHYKGLVVVNNHGELSRVQSRLTKDLKVPRNRYRIQLAKPAKDGPGEVQLFITPQLIKEAN